MRRGPGSLLLATTSGAVAAALVLGGCTADAEDPAPAAPSSSAAPTGGEDGLALAAVPSQANTLVAGTSADQLAAGASSALFSSASRAVVAGADDAGAQEQARTAAEHLGLPALVTGDAAAAEVGRLGAEVVPVGEQARTWTDEQGLSTADDAEELLSEAGTARASTPAPGGTPTAVVLSTGAAETALAAATAQAAGAEVVVVAGGDPRADGALVSRLGDAQQVPVVALGDAFGPAEQLDARLATVRTGVQVPGPDGLGGQLPLAGRRLVALYGHPGTPSLGVLGEQDVPATLQRAQDVAATYTGLDDRPPAPALEVIATVASSTPGADGDYSTETPVAELEPLVRAALDDGVQVVLDLQPGRSTFLEQARQYEELLALPGVGLALDPEWRLAPGQVHLDQIGRVSADEVDETSAWLAQLVRERALPQKVFLLHQFRTSMVTDRSSLDTSHDELAFVVHADGAGAPGDKRATYAALTADAPSAVQWGWKNFYDEDSPTFTPAETVAEQPVPVFVSYQ